MKKLLFVLALIACLVSCSSPTSTSSSSKKEEDKKTQSNGPELVVDKDNIRHLNNATDSEITQWDWRRYDPAVGFPEDYYGFSNGGMYSLTFNFQSGKKWIDINGPNSSVIFRNYFCLRKGPDGNFYLIYYKEEDEEKSNAKNGMVYKYCYICYKYKLSENYLSLEQSDMKIDDVYNYVKDKM